MNPITITPAAAEKYRPDVDGLRAIAVLCVVWFHFGVETFSGGFIGVDVFFVISGFLITRLILEAVSAEKFTFSGFYLRRARRLLPALLFTVAASFAMGYLVFTPQHLERLGGSALHGLLSISNFFFWSESGYFDADSRVKPLLHLWSLSVEEQFYFIWPATLVLLCKTGLPRGGLIVVLVLLGVASLAFAQWCLGVDPSAAFYMLPSRIVEFCMGAVLVPLVHVKAPNWIREIALLVGLLLIGYAAVAFTESTPFPGTNALIPCLGTSLAIFGGSSRIAGSLLRSKPLVFTGLISYSLYLCHWPIYVFYIYMTETAELTYLQLALLTAVAYVVATLMYRFVERPFRFTKPGPQADLASTRFALGSALLALVIAYTSAHAWANQGWFWRFGNTGELAEIFDLDRLRIETIEYSNEHVKGAAFGGGVKRILVLGDSHARDVANGLSLTLSGKGYQVRSMELDDSCLHYLNEEGTEVDKEPVIPESKFAQDLGPRRCTVQINTFLKSSKPERADIVIYSAALYEETSKVIDRFVRLVQHASKQNDLKIVIMDRAVGFRGLHGYAIKAYAKGTPAEEINRHAFTVSTGPFYYRVLESTLKEAGLLEDVTLARKYRLQCRKPACQFFVNDDSLGIWDANHWTLAGAELYMSRFVEEHADVFP